MSQYRKGYETDNNVVNGDKMSTPKVLSHCMEWPFVMIMVKVVRFICNWLNYGRLIGDGMEYLLYAY